MKTNVSTLLREFPKLRRAAFEGEEIIIETREGNLRLTADKPAGARILGSLKDEILASEDVIAEPTTEPGDWNPSL